MQFTQFNNPYNDVVYNIEFGVFESSIFFCGYAYDVSNIEVALDMLNDKNIYNLVHDEICVDWQDARALSDATIDESLKHSLRIAMLINLIKQGNNIHPVSIDTFAKSWSCLEGHHRLLALKYLGYSTFPAYLSGSVDELETNLNVCMDDEPNTIIIEG